MFYLKKEGEKMLLNIEQTIMFYKWTTKNSILIHFNLRKEYFCQC